MHCLICMRDAQGRCTTEILAITIFFCIFLSIIMDCFTHDLFMSRGFCVIYSTHALYVNEFNCVTCLLDILVIDLTLTFVIIVVTINKLQLYIISYY